MIKEHIRTELLDIVHFIMHKVTHFVGTRRMLGGCEKNTKHILSVAVGGLILP